MFWRLIQTSDSPVPALLRLTLGTVMFAHGAQKMLGWWGGNGFEGTMQYFTGMMGIPAPLALLAITAEFFGGLGLIVGLLTRVAAFGTFCVMLVALLTVHLRFGFFMNWQGQQPGEGFEYHLLAMAVSIAVMWQGAGAWSIDRMLAGSRGTNPLKTFETPHHGTAH